MWRFLYKTNKKGEKIPIAPPPPKPTLPDASTSKTFVEARDTIAANTEVASNMEIDSRKKRGDYQSYTAEQRAKIGKYAQLNGNAAAKRKFDPIGESTVRTFKKKYIEQCKVTEGEVTEIANKDPGRPLKIGKEIDDRVKKYVRNLRIGGGRVNRAIVMAAARGIVKTSAAHMLPENGGTLDIGDSWARSLLERMNYVLRKGTKAARKVPDDFEEIRDAFHKRVESSIASGSVHPDMFVNFDQTNCKYFPATEWTLEERGTKQIAITGLEDKREITVMVAASASGKLLPFQVIYAGKTDKCHPKAQFPPEWDITHTESHWSNVNAMIRYVERVLDPYFTAQREAHGLPDDAKAIALFDVFRAHQSDLFLEELYKCHIIPIFVPASCTGELQPMDLTVNGEFKRILRSNFTQWYADEMNRQMTELEDEGGEADITKVHVDMRISYLKPIHAGWLITAFGMLELKTDLIKLGFLKAGIVDSMFGM